MQDEMKKQWAEQAKETREAIERSKTAEGRAFNKSCVRYDSKPYVIPNTQSVREFFERFPA
jgi:hypothetical protein